MNSESKYDQIFVLLEESLITVKSGAREPKNIADFMPDYNFWYALKFSKPEKITIIGDKNISYSPNSMYIDTKLRFIEIWLSELTEVKCNSGYSYYGNWKFLFGRSDEDLIDFFKIKKPGNILFIDRDNNKHKDYINEKENIEYTTKSEFIKIFNKNQRVYTRQRYDFLAR